MAKILVIEDEENLRYSIKRTLARDGHSVADADRLVPALALVQSHEPDVVITDLNLAGGDQGLDLVKRLRAEGNTAAVIVITAYGTVETAVDAVKQGADEFLQKPLSMEELRVVVGRTIENRKVRNRLSLYERIEKSTRVHEQMLGESPAWRKTVELAQRLAQLPVTGGGEPTTILLQGETGVGKGMLARFIHDSSAEAAEPFVHVNCSALPANLIEGELFGHEKGAFTDARETRQGLFELADGGTIFLDEINSASAGMQLKLLRVLQERRFEPVGSTKTVEVNVRVVLASNEPLEQLVASGQFRQDLYYRINVVTIELPPLRDRLTDVPVLAEHFLEKQNRAAGRQIIGFAPDAMAALERYAWPGNVRELENTVERAVVLCRGPKIGVEDLPPRILENRPLHLSLRLPRHDDAAAAPWQGETLAQALESQERRIILAALSANNWNRNRTAAQLGINRTTLYKKIRAFRLDELSQAG